jgi:DNA-directed RNA polymerase subunit RPC12/RpoP
VTPEGRPLLFCTECNRGLPLPQTGEIVKKQPTFACPLCQFDVLEVSAKLLY